MPMIEIDEFSGLTGIRLNIIYSEHNSKEEKNGSIFFSFTIQKIRKKTNWFLSRRILKLIRNYRLYKMLNLMPFSQQSY